MNEIIKVENVKKSFSKPNGSELLVLDDVNFSISSGEIVAILGKSGSGKSTLLRIMAGLNRANAGKVFFGDQEVTKPLPGLTMVFQHFALMPWLTVLGNVVLGLEAQGVGKEESRKRALKAIDVVGLDGFESAYPKELSGGMSQRVGFARALVVNPKILLMDEPFSALDVLTAENLRGDLVGILKGKQTSIEGVLLVTHNIEEAAFMADRILVFSHDPGRIHAEIKVNLSHPRNDSSPEFRALVNKIYTAMTQLEHASRSKTKKIEVGMGYRLPDVDISEIMGLIELIASEEFEDHADLPEIADTLHLDIDELFSITEALEVLRLANVAEGDIKLTPIGHELAGVDLLKQKTIFAHQLLSHIPLARHIRRVLDERPSHKASKNRFLQELEDYLSEQVAEEVLTVMIDWGRYAELFAYDANSGVLSLENPQ
jgi:NitT/TauT family transport system ATP-binding protein